MKKLFYFLPLAVIILLGIYYFFPEKELSKNSKIDYILVEKSKRKMNVFSKGELLKTYTISLGDNPIGHKEYEGDEKTPEGIYTINAKNPLGGYHKNLGISYPNNEDRKHAKELGKPVGGDVKIHSLKNGRGFIGKFQRWKDWTNGCIAVTNDEMDELYNSTATNTTIEIKP